MSRWVVVGAGIHGTYVARALREAGVSADELTVLDRRGAFLGSFREKAVACGMESLRSTYVQHLGPEPFGLETFAETRDRTDELLATADYPSRPSLSLFVDHAEDVIERFDLRQSLHGATATSFGSRDGLVVETTDGRLDTDRIVLAVGPGDRYRRPDWARGVERIEHVWDAVGPPADRVDDGDDVWVVGGGITAGQFARSVADVADSVTICSRDPLQEATIEADPRWLNWPYIESELHSLPPGSTARLERIREARYDGTIPSYIANSLRGTPNVTIRTGEIRAATSIDGRVALSLRDGSFETTDALFLATGFERAADSSVIARVADSLDLERGAAGIPVLDDGTLAWRRNDGSRSNVFVTGVLAESVIGPFAGNVPGARRAAERLVGTVHSGRRDGSTTISVRQ